MLLFSDLKNTKDTDDDGCWLQLQGFAVVTNGWLAQMMQQALSGPLVCFFLPVCLYIFINTMLPFLGLMTTKTTNNNHDDEHWLPPPRWIVDANYNKTIGSGEEEQLANLDDATCICLGLCFFFFWPVYLYFY